MEDPFFEYTGPVSSLPICTAHDKSWRPHSLARLEVTLASGSGRSSVRTTNVSTFSLDLKTWLDACNRGNISLLETSEGEEVDEAIRWSVISVLNVDGNEITLEMEDRRYSGEGNVWFAKDGSSSEGVLTWKVRSLVPHFVNIYSSWLTSRSLAIPPLPKQHNPQSTPSTSPSDSI